ncbi:hypothetical protein ACJX0J_023093, partial [Zea mays]
MKLLYRHTLRKETTVVHTLMDGYKIISESPLSPLVYGASVHDLGAILNNYFKTTRIFLIIRLYFKEICN